MQNRCAEIEIRAERKAGEMLSETVEHGGDRKSESSSHAVTLKNLGIGRMDSSRWQSIASIPEEQLERHCGFRISFGPSLSSRIWVDACAQHHL